ncbi:hypothetical protein D8674_014086 [Pyrus ussuriensis x Pyrus communis]|uniref:Uncharacterized protein n=1 Tax=Pyrus ussuriensis x Pyrus communis TaxID=2448454 RepID=A0A5N5GST3_9ROSA|nr:hypothetical protein D8674_014086 [Pyrus ussuriensis x Pyrus communis]
MAAKYEVRSISLPSRSHPTTIRVEEELSRRQTSSASASICKVLCGLEELYDCCMDELLDGSLRLLDICGITRDAMSQIKEHVRDLQSALRRRKGDSNIESSIASYNCFRKKMKKDTKKLITSLKQVNNKASQRMVHDQRAPAVVRVLREVFDKKEDIHGHELDGVDAALYSLCKSSSAPTEGTNVEKIQNAHKQLEALEVTVEGLEKGLESVLRRLIKTRASLLNRISQ